MEKDNLFKFLEENKENCYEGETNCLLYSCHETPSRLYLFENNWVDSKREGENINENLTKDKYLKTLNSKITIAIEISNKFRDKKTRFYETLVKREDYLKEIVQMNEEIKKKSLLIKSLQEKSNKKNKKQIVQHLIEILNGFQFKHIKNFNEKLFNISIELNKYSILHLLLMKGEDGTLKIKYDLTKHQNNHDFLFEDACKAIIDKIAFGSKKYKCFYKFMNDFTFSIKLLNFLFEILKQITEINGEYICVNFEKYRQKFILNGFLIKETIMNEGIRKFKAIIDPLAWICEPLIIEINDERKTISFKELRELLVASFADENKEMLIEN